MFWKILEHEIKGTDTVTSLGRSTVRKYIYCKN